MARLHLDAVPDLPPADQPPVLLHSSTERDLFADGRANGGGQTNLGQVSLDGDDAAAGRQRPDVDHQHLVLGKLRHLGTLLVALQSDSEQSPELKFKGSVISWTRLIVEIRSKFRQLSLR